MCRLPGDLSKETTGLELLDSGERAAEQLQAPEMQTMYNLPMPISTIRTRIRQEFERHRYVSKLPVADVLLFKSHAEYQVGISVETWGREHG